MTTLKIALLVLILLIASLNGGCAGILNPSPLPPVITPATSPAPNPASPSAVTPVPTVTASTPPLLTPPAGAESIIARVQQSAAAASGYRLVRETSALKTGSNQGGTEAYDLSAWSDMKLDLSSRRLQMDNRYVVKGPPGKPEWPSFENLIYVWDDVIYIRGLFPDEPQLWGRTAATEEYWQRQDQLASLLDFLNVANTTVLDPEYREEKGNRLPCDVLLVKPDLDRFWTFMLQQPGIQTFQLPAGPPAGVAFSDIIRNAGLKIWVSQVDGAPVRAELLLDMQLGPAQVATFKSEFTLNVIVTMQFTDYNNKPELTFPDEAKDAIELNFETAAP